MVKAFEAPASKVDARSEAPCQFERPIATQTGCKADETNSKHPKKRIAGQDIRRSASLRQKQPSAESQVLVHRRLAAQVEKSEKRRKRRIALCPRAACLFRLVVLELSYLLGWSNFLGKLNETGNMGGPSRLPEFLGREAPDTGLGHPCAVPCFLFFSGGFSMGLSQPKVGGSSLQIHPTATSLRQETPKASFVLAQDMAVAETFGQSTARVFMDVLPPGAFFFFFWGGGRWGVTCFSSVDPTWGWLQCSLGGLVFPAKKFNLKKAIHNLFTSCGYEMLQVIHGCGEIGGGGGF